jgi:hypothetical protein
MRARAASGRPGPHDQPRRPRRLADAGKTFSRPAFERLLAEFPLYNLQIEPWQVEYDLVWARKSG